MLKYLDRKEKESSRDLWEEAFPEDSKTFDDYYFSKKIKENRILAIEEDRRIQSMIQLNPYLVRAKERRWRVDYLVGVATRKDKRHQGYMSRLLLQMMTDMRAERMPFCFLMPADEAIYRPFGFTYIYDQPQMKLRDHVALTREALTTMPASEAASGTEPKLSLKSQYHIARAARWMEGWLEQRYQVFTVRDQAYVEGLLEEIASENGTIEMLFDGDKLVGLQSFWGLKEPEQRLLYAEDAYTEAAGDAKPAIMARIITLEEFLKVIRLREHAASDELVIQLWLDDPLIEENQGLWFWHLNHEASWVEREPAGQSAIEGGYESAELTLTIAELTAWLFGYRVPEAAEPWNAMIETLQDVFLDEVI